MNSIVGIQDHSGSKYLRRIRSPINNQTTIVDAYAMIVACDVKNPGVQHALKKLLYSGLRGKGDAIQDIKESIDALYRAIEIENGLIADEIEQSAKSNEGCVSGRCPPRKPLAPFMKEAIKKVANELVGKAFTDKTPSTAEVLFRETCTKGKFEIEPQDAIKLIEQTQSPIVIELYEKEWIHFKVGTMAPLPIDPPKQEEVGKTKEEPTTRENYTVPTEPSWIVVREHNNESPPRIIGHKVVWNVRDGFGVFPTAEKLHPELCSVFIVGKNSTSQDDSWKRSLDIAELLNKLDSKGLGISPQE